MLLLKMPQLLPFIFTQKKMRVYKNITYSVALVFELYYFKFYDPYLLN